MTLLNSPRTITSGTRNLVLSNMGNCFSLWKRSTMIGIYIFEWMKSSSMSQQKKNKKGMSLLLPYPDIFDEFDQCLVFARLNQNQKKN